MMHESTNINFTLTCWLIIVCCVF